SLTEHWDGSRWRVRSSPSPAGYIDDLYGSFAFSAQDVWSVGESARQGSGDKPLAEHWDGRRWRAIGTGRGESLNAVGGACPVDMWAVGTTGSVTLTDHWDGSSWTTVPSPSVPHVGNLLFGVTAISSTDVWAVGQEQT